MIWAEAGEGPDRFRCDMACLWKAGVIDESQFDALMALFKEHKGKNHADVAALLERELRGME